MEGRRKKELDIVMEYPSKYLTTYSLAREEAQTRGDHEGKVASQSGSRIQREGELPRLRQHNYGFGTAVFSDTMHAVIVTVER